MPLYSLSIETRNELKTGQDKTHLSLSREMINLSYMTFQVGHRTILSVVIFFNRDQQQ